MPDCRVTGAEEKMNLESVMGVAITECHAVELISTHQSNGIAHIKVQVSLSWALRSKNGYKHRIGTSVAAAAFGAHLCKKPYEDQSVAEFQNKHLC